MMYKISKGGVEGCSSDTKRLVYLVASIQRIQEVGLGFAFTDGHPIMALTNFYDDVARIDQVDWEVMKMQYWADTKADPDRERRRQAEFLVHSSLPWDAVEFVAVATPKIKGRVEAIIDEYPDRLKPVKVVSGWYFY